MAKINAELEEQLQSRPNQSFDLIVRTDGDATPHLDWLAANGLTVKQQYKLTPGVAVSASGAAALKLLDQDWVVSVESDQPVQAMS